MPLFILILALDNATSSWEEGTHWFGIKIGHFAPESKVPLLAKRLPLALFWNDFDLVIPNAIVLFNNKSSNQRHMTSKTDVQTNIKDLGQCRGGAQYLPTWQRSRFRHKRSAVWIRPSAIEIGQKFLLPMLNTYPCEEGAERPGMAHLKKICTCVRIISLASVWPDWAIFWTLGNLLKPLAAINLPNLPHS